VPPKQEARKPKREDVDAPREEAEETQRMLTGPASRDA